MSREFIGLCTAIVLVTLTLSGCGSSGGGGSDDAGPSNLENPTTPGGGTQTPAGATLEVTGEREFAADDSLKLHVDLKELSNDDAVYLSISSDELVANTLTVSPEQSVIYPTNGDVSLTVSVKDNGLMSNATLRVKVVTAANQALQKDIVIIPNAN